MLISAKIAHASVFYKAVNMFSVEGAVLGGQESDSRKQCEGGEERMVGSHWLLKRQVQIVLAANYV